MNINGREYTYIDFYDGTDTTRHYLKDATARQSIEDLAQRIPRNIKDGTGEGAVIENYIVPDDLDEPINVASGLNSHAEGHSTTATSQAAHAEGVLTVASGHESHAEGMNTTASGDDSHAEGFQTTASGSASHAEGSLAQASGRGAHAEGRNTSASGAFSHAEGFNVVASGANAHASGKGTIASHADQYVFGAYNEPDPSDAEASEHGNYVEIVGNGTDVVPSNARTLDWGGNEIISGTLTVEKGSQNEAVISGARWNRIPNNIRDGSGVGATIENLVEITDNAINAATGEYAHAEGYATSAGGHASHAEGERTNVLGRASHAEGTGTIARHRNQHVFGKYNVADPSVMDFNSDGTYIEIVGNGTAADLRRNARTLDWNGNERLAGALTLGVGSVDETSVTASELKSIKAIQTVPVNLCDGIGSGAVVIASTTPSRASGDNSVAESSGNATGRNSHAEGNGTLAQGVYSHAEGYNSTASGEASHAEGYTAVANGRYAHAEGEGTIASGQSQHVSGKYNLPDSSYAEIIGNGIANSRSNARTLDWQGNEVIAGTITANGVNLNEVVSGIQDIMSTTAASLSEFKTYLGLT